RRCGPVTHQPPLAGVACRRTLRHVPGLGAGGRRRGGRPPAARSPRPPPPARAAADPGPAARRLHVGPLPARGPQRALLRAVLAARSLPRAGPSGRTRGAPRLPRGDHPGGGAGGRLPHRPRRGAGLAHASAAGVHGRARYRYADALVNEASRRGEVLSDADTDAAVAALEKALRQTPHFADAAELLARLRPQPARGRIALLEPAFAREPQRTDIAITLSGLYVRVNEMRRAAM